ncbi:MAG: DUF2292 domain-containing protein [Deltaproteobacteria bacterium]|nr:DUF2292 domain-containing protein [Deltaproteobacteria bacterium]TLN02028.1 MAG: DUF2292 domain-containing protein [bacterium]
MNRNTAAPVLHPDLEREIREALVSIRFGTVTLVVQDGRVIQLDKSEKIRLAGPTFRDGGGI